MKVKKINIQKYFSSKSFSDENFPVASFLISNNHKKHIKNLYFFARNADDIADNQSLEPAKKIEILKLLDDLILNKKVSVYPFIDNLIYSLTETKVPVSYPRSLLKAFLQDAKKTTYEKWSDLIEYCNNSASPIGRFVVHLIIYKKVRDKKKLNLIFRGCDNLCNALQILNHLQDCKEDFVKLNRIYIPEDFCKVEKIISKDIFKIENREKFLRIKDRCLTKIEIMLKISIKPIKSIPDFRLRMETLVIFYVAKKLCYLLKNNDPIKKKVKLSHIDLIFCFFKGIIRSL